jgi:single-strand DNA-binding protein
MAKNANHIMVVGNLTRDPETKQTNTGANYCKFGIANNNDYKKDGQEVKQVSYFDCVVWLKLGEIAQKYLSKGKKVCVSGRMQQRSWDDDSGNKRYAWEIIVSDFEILTPREEGSSDHYNSQPQANYGQQPSTPPNQQQYQQSPPPGNNPFVPPREDPKKYGYAPDITPEYIPSGQDDDVPF